MVNKFLKLFLLLIPLLAAAYYTLMWAFGCGFGGEAFVCHTLLSVSIYLLIGCAVSFIVLCITYFTDNKQIGTLFLKLYIVLFVLFLLALIFAQNFKQIPEYVRMQNFNNQTVESCTPSPSPYPNYSPDSCLMAILEAQVYGGKKDIINLCSKIHDNYTRTNCSLIYDAIANNNFKACEDITYPPGLVYRNFGYYIDGTHMPILDKDFCYQNIATRNSIDFENYRSLERMGKEVCSDKTNIIAKNFCYYQKHECGSITSASVMQKDCEIHKNNL